MAPIRRYLRITKHSVLEVRIYLDRPSDAEAWLLRRENPALPRVIQAVRPLVLPKLREENERAKGRKARKKGVKDVVVEDDFDVSIFLTELSTRHSLLIKQKDFKDKPRLQSNSGKFTNWLTTGTSEQPVVVPDESADPVIRREEHEEETINLDEIPEASEDDASETSVRPERPGHRKRRRKDSGESNFQTEESESDGEINSRHQQNLKRKKRKDENEDEEAEMQDDKKKLGLNTSYDGFSIYGRILCLVVKRKGSKVAASGSGAPISSQQMLENWVSTQAAAEVGDDEDDNG